MLPRSPYSCALRLQVAVGKWGRWAFAQGPSDHCSSHLEGSRREKDCFLAWDRLLGAVCPAAVRFAERIVFVGAAYDGKQRSSRRKLTLEDG